MAAPLLPWFVIGAVSLAALGLNKKASAKQPDELDELDPVDPIEPVKHKWPRAQVDEAMRIALESGNPAVMLTLAGELEADGYLEEAAQLKEAAKRAAQDIEVINPAPGHVSTMPVPPSIPSGSVPVSPPIKVDVPPIGTIEIPAPVIVPTPSPLPALPSLPSVPGFGTMPVGGQVPIDATPIKPPIKVPVPPPDAVPIPAPKPAAPKPDLSTRQGVAAATYAMLMNSEPSRKVEDPALLKLYQGQESLDADGVYGPATGKSLIKYGFVPPRPFQSMSSKAAKNWRDNMNYMANKDPQRAEEWRQAAMV